MKYAIIIMTMVTAIFISLTPYAASAEAGSKVDEKAVEGFEEALDADDTVFEFDSGTDPEEFGDEDTAFDNESADVFDSDPAVNMEDTKTSFLSSLLNGARFTLEHEAFYKVVNPTGLMSNRSSARLTVSRPIGRYFFLQLDTKETFFWKNDHRAEAVDKTVTTDSFTREAFLQASFADTSIKAGVQILIWGESEGGAITDVVSPRDYSEAFFVGLEESRIGQPMVLLDQFTSFGDVSLFFVPDAQFNEYPGKNTAYEYDIFNASTTYREESASDAKSEFGARWKKTFGQSDVALMAASLIENDYAYRLDGVTDTDDMILSKHKKRFSMAGIAFNYVRGNFLYKGEMGIKMPRHFNNSDLQIKKKDVLDTALGFDYSPGGTYTLSLELVNSHIMNWESDLVGVREDSNRVILAWQKNFLHETLSVNWMTIYTTFGRNFLHTLRTAYEWNNDLTLEFEAYWPDISDPENDLWIYRDQKQVAFKIQIQF